MSKRKLTATQVASLLKNENVAKCSDRAISYNKDFKLRAVKRYQDEGLTAKQIFREAGFDLLAIGEDTPEDRLKNWRKIFKKKGGSGLTTESRGRGGGRPRTKGVTDEDKIKRLEATVAYLKAENDFLAKLRAKKRAE